MARIIKNASIKEDAHILGAQETPQTFTLPPEYSLTESQYEALKTEAWQEGYRLGKEAQAAEDSPLPLKSQLEALLSSFTEALHKARLASTDEIADVVLLIIERYFIDRQRDPQSLKLHIEHILSQINTKSQIELFLHPEDLNLLQKAHIKLDTSHLNGLKIKSQTDMALGGCLIKTEHGVFDGRLETQIDKLKTFLLQVKHRDYHELSA